MHLNNLNKFYLEKNTFSVGQFQNELMKSSFFTKYEPNSVCATVDSHCLEHAGCITLFPQRDVNVETTILHMLLHC